MEYDENDMDTIIDSFYWEEEDQPGFTYFDSPHHNPPGILAVGQEILGRCPCICHCVSCLEKAWN